MNLNTPSRLFVGTLAVVGVSLFAEGAGAETIGVTAKVNQVCSLTSNVTDVAFGDYTPSLTSPPEKKGTFEINCAFAGSVPVTLNGGLSPQGNFRRMTGSQGDFIQYGLYAGTNAASPWDISQPKNVTVVSGDTEVDVFGIILGNAANAAVGAGDYEDTVTITATF